MKAGNYEGTISSYGVSTTKAGKPVIVIDFKVADDSIRWNGYLSSPMAIEIACKTLADLGYKETSFEKLADGEGLDDSRVYFLTVKEEEYNGKLYSKIAWINLEPINSNFVAPKELKALLGGVDFSANLVMAQQETKRDSVKVVAAPASNDVATFDSSDIPFQMIISIDPGLTGGAVVVKDDGSVIRYTLFERGMSDFFKLIKSNRIHNPKVIIEDVRGYAGENVKGIFTFGKTLGWVEGMLIAADYKLKEVERVSPKSWTSFFKEVFDGNKTKQKSCLAIKKIFKNEMEEKGLKQVVRYEFIDFKA